jgi:hypothetical protein
MYYKYNEFTPEQIAEMKGYFKNANYYYIYLSVFVALFGFVSRAYRWKFSIEHMGYRSHFHNNLMAVCVAYFMNLTIPRSGEISRALILKKYENIPFDKAFGTIVAERVVDLFIFFLFVVVSFLVQFDLQKEKNENNYLYSNIKKKYEETGIKMYGKAFKPPHILFWNLDYNDGFPSLSNQANCSMLSGYNTNFLNIFSNSEEKSSLTSSTPWSIFLKSIQNKRYRILEKRIIEVFLL